jgi:hypothetical protein
LDAVALAIPGAETFESDAVSSPVGTVVQPTRSTLAL